MSPYMFSGRVEGYWVTLSDGFHLEVDVWSVLTSKSILADNKSLDVYTAHGNIYIYFLFLDPQSLLFALCTWYTHRQEQHRDGTSPQTLRRKQILKGFSLRVDHSSAAEPKNSLAFFLVYLPKDLLRPRPNRSMKKARTWISSKSEKWECSSLITAPILRRSSNFHAGQFLNLWLFALLWATPNRMEGSSV